MIAKFIVFALLWRLTGNPLLALLILLAVLYILDRRYVGLLPSLSKPFRRRAMLNRLRQEYGLNPHQVSSKAEAARLLNEMRRYRQAHALLADVLPQMGQSAEVQVDYGLSCLRLGKLEEGERHLLQALEINPNVRYGEPYLVLGEGFASSDPDKALNYLLQFREMHSSSCEGYYFLGNLYRKLGKQSEAKEAYREAGQVYRSLPRYRRKSERRWALLAWLKSL